jgi:phosphoribosylaminoimidazole carboxylase PurE protein
MFEAIHGSAPRRAGLNMANPSGLLHGAFLMLVHIGQPDVAERAHNAWLRTIEDGVHTYDIFQEGVSKQKVGTKEFAEAVVARVGKEPEKLMPVRYPTVAQESMKQTLTVYPPAKKELIGVDVFLHWNDRNPTALGKKLDQLNGDGLKMTVLGNRGVAVYP